MPYVRGAIVSINKIINLLLLIFILEKMSTIAEHMSSIFNPES